MILIKLNGEKLPPLLSQRSVLQKNLGKSVLLKHMVGVFYLLEPKNFLGQG